LNCGREATAAALRAAAPRLRQPAMAKVWSLGGVSADDLLEMAAMVEQGGFDFYARLTARSLDPRVRNELKFLRDEEAMHKSWFLGQLRARGGAPRGALAPALQQSLDDEFLGPLEEVLQRGGADVDTARALQMGSELEQKAIAFYTAMQEVVEPGLKAELGRIMQEEEAHCRKLDLIRGS
jgi:rubrerythrin